MKTVIYGIGEAAQQLIRLLEKSAYVQFTGFFDDFTSLEEFEDVPRIDLIKIDELVASSEIDQIILAIPSLNSRQRVRILEKLSKYAIPISVLPFRKEMFSDKVKLSDLKPVELSDLIHRQEFQINIEALHRMLDGKVVFVSGGGGSIGSELCVQISESKVDRVVIFDSCEFNLFKIYEKLRSVGKPIIPILGDIRNYNDLKRSFERERPDYVFHAAAYKHVDLVQQNPFTAWENNVLGTMNILEVSKFFNVKSFTLISSDKAVRPTNVMGATKRLCELITQTFMKKNPFCAYQTVRFGNVFGSSGSVVPIFDKQIDKGGPLTVRHPEVTRYFMSIPEACTLVLEVGVLLQKRGIFLLNMGEPVRILDLAKKLILLRGYQVGEAGIEIEFTGLRPGEKLFEELLIDEKLSFKISDKIYGSYEEEILPDSFIEEIRSVINEKQSVDFFVKYVSGFKRA